MILSLIIGFCILGRYTPSGLTGFWRKAFKSPLLYISVALLLLTIPYAFIAVGVGLDVKYAQKLYLDILMMGIGFSGRIKGRLKYAKDNNVELNFAPPDNNSRDLFLFLIGWVIMLGWWLVTDEKLNNNQPTNQPINQSIASHYHNQLIKSHLTHHLRIYWMATN